MTLDCSKLRILQHRPRTSAIPTKPGNICFSTRWEWTSSSSDYYLDPVVLRLSESSLCRGYHENRLIPGSTDHTGRCAVGFFGRVYKLDKYQVRADSDGITQPFFVRFALNVITIRSCLNKLLQIISDNINMLLYMYDMTIVY